MSDRDNSGLYRCNLQIHCSQVVDHYSKECDGLLCKLSEVCPREDLPEGVRHMTKNLEIQRELVELKETLGK